MSYDVKGKQLFNQPAGEVSESVADILVQLGGKTSGGSNPAKGQLQATFNKKIKERALPNRCQLQVKVVAKSADSCMVMVKCFPVDPMGSKLTFGVRGDASQVVLDTFLGELTQQIKS